MIIKSKLESSKSSKSPAIAGNSHSMAALSAIAGMLLASASSSAQEVIASDAQGEYVRGRVVVLTRAGMPESELTKVVGMHGGRARALGRSGLFVIELPGQASETAVAQQLSHNPHLKFAELDRYFRISFTPNDPYFGSQWHSAKMEASAAWDLSQGSGVTIAILDTGVDSSHPDLSSQVVPGWNFYSRNSDTSDVQGHGTGMAGIAAASLNNGAGVAGIAGKARIMPIRVTDTNGGASASTVAEALNYVADKGVRIASMSLGGMAGNSTVQTAAQYLKSKGGLLFSSAGNNARDEGIAPTTTMIVVSATDQNDGLASFSSWGSFIAMSAPGVSVYSATRGGGYAAWSGTSASTPLVASTAALMMSAQPTLSCSQIESLLFSSASDLGTAGRDKYFGYGRVSSGAAVRAALAATGTTADTIAPTASVSSPTGGSTVSGLVAVNVTATDNIGVAKVELRVNGATVATDTSSPYGFSWDSTKTTNGAVTFTAVAYDAAGNATTSAPVSANASNTAVNVVSDTTPPVLLILSPTGGSTIGSGVTVSASASDNSGSAGITQYVYVDGALKSSVTGGSLSYRLNSRKLAAGTHSIQVVARDQAGNKSSATVQVNK